MSDPDAATPGSRMRRALTRPGRGQVVVAVLVGLLGFAMVTQVRAHTRDDSYSGLRSDELVQVLNGLTVESRRTSQQIADLEESRRRLRDSTQRTAEAVDQARQEAVALGLLAGTVPAQGPGIRITVQDPLDRLTLNHLLDGIEELRDAGAEVMEINDSVRVVAQTWFDTADGGGLVVDGQQLRAPYVIEAVGSPDDLARALTFTGGFIDDVTEDRASVRVVKRDRVEITATVGDVAPRYSEPASGQ